VRRNDDSYQRERRRRLLRIGVGVAVAVAVLLLIALVAPFITTAFGWQLRRALFWLVPLAVLVGAIIGLAAGYAATDRTGLAVLAWVIGIAGGATFIWYAASYHSYQQAHAYSHAGLHTVSNQVPTFGQRAPYEVAQAQARPDLGALPGDASEPTFLPAEGKFGTLVTRRGAFTGYQALLEQKIPLAGHGSATTCSFSATANARLDGWFSHNLARELANHRRWVKFSDSDVYGYCDHGVPKVVVPLKRQVGWLIVTERSAGYAVYDGRTGHFTFSADGARVQGPSYPLSLAAEQREGTAGARSYGDWWFGRAGWATSDEVGANDGEFVLPDGSSGAFVTPLTARGHATAVSALSTVDAQATGRGLNPITVHELTPSWTSPSAIEQRIRADYQDLPNWQQQKVMEIAPLSGSRWVATIGNGQNILYRVQGTGDLNGTLRNGSATCLYYSTGELVRCGTLALTNGNGVGTQYGGTGTGTGAPPTDLSKLSNQQLEELQRQVDAEMARRLNGGK
jgi:hypothetical protein